MPTKAHERAQMCRTRADECLLLAATADPSMRQHYRSLAESYLQLAKTEEMFAEELERLNPSAQ